MIIVVTGCTQGLGRECVKYLIANSEAVIIFACRNVSSAQKVAGTLSDSRCIVLETPLNLAECDSVREFCSELHNWLNGRKIYSLVNNAGIGGQPHRRKTSQGYDEIWATNYLGHFLLTILLLRDMDERSRIINVSSEVHDPATDTGMPDPTVQWPESVEEYNTYLACGAQNFNESIITSANRQYTKSKLCNVMFTYELARRLNIRGSLPFFVSEQTAAVIGAEEDHANIRSSLPAAGSISVIAMNPGLMVCSTLS